jgi:hypothetical protein
MSLCGTKIVVATAAIYTTIRTRSSKHDVAVTATFTKEQCLVRILRICLLGNGKSLVDLSFVITCGL